MQQQHIPPTQGTVRMMAVVVNWVTALHRARIGQLALPADLAPGEWRWLSAEDVAAAGRAA